MNRRIRFLPYLFLFALSFFLLAASEPPASIQVSEEEKSELSSAFNQRFQNEAFSDTTGVSAFIPELDTAFKTPDGSIALLWLALRDDSGYILATEPGLAIAQKTDTGWNIVMPGDTDWKELFTSLPEEMLPLEHRPAPFANENDELSEPQVLTGYYLPYIAGTKQWLEGSISHFQYIPELGYPSCPIETCQYAYDFTNDNHFPLVASKDGTVYASKDSCSDGNSSCTNYIVLRDTNNQTYQIYLHLSHNTIPDKLTNGTFVKRGQYLGDTDDTGYSTSNHVHFMVTNSIWAASGYYWGYSTKIQFMDVPINNGIPRTCYEVTNFSIYDGATECIGDKSNPRSPSNDWFISGNIGAYPPTGSFTRPTPGKIVAIGDNPLMDVTATAFDDVAVKAVRLVAKLNGEWVEIGPKVTQPYTTDTYDWDVNLCDVGPLNGPLEVALNVWDHEGNKTTALSPRTIQVDHACPPPSSAMNSPQTFDSTATKLSWTAISGKAGIASFEIQWRPEPGVWSPGNNILVPTSQQYAWFAGTKGGTYAFRMRAFDENGQAEPWSANDQPEINLTFPSTCVPDEFEEDDASVSAIELNQGEVAIRNICGEQDPDWFKINIPLKGFYQVASKSVNGGAAVKISIYEEDGETLVASGQASGIGFPTSTILWMESPGWLYVKIEPLVSQLMGTDASYNVRFDKVEVIYLPVLSR